MKRTTLATLATIALLSAGIAAIAPAQEPKKPAPKITIEEFRAKLKKDSSPLPAGGQMQMSYAPVVEKILPSVVTIKVYGMSQGRQRRLFGGRSPEELPPQFREFFRQWFGLPGGEEFGAPDNEDDQDDNPRGRGERRRPTPREEDQSPEGTGSGFIISADGYVLTNNHVVEDARKIEVICTAANGDSKSYDAKVIGTDPPSDVALLKIEAAGLPQATLGDSEKLRVGDVVLAAGAPLELDHSVSQGIVSAMGRTNLGIIARRQGRSYENFIQTDAAINLGNSGGPLVDALGRVIGINTAIFAGNGGLNGGIGFAIPLAQALTVVEDLLDDGKVQRGYLGVLPVDVDKETAKVLGFTEPSGALVQVVTPDSPASKAGLEVGDVIVTAAGQRVDSGAKLRLVVGNQKPGASIPLEVYRGKEKLNITAKLEALPDNIAAVGSGGATPEVKEPAAKPSEIIEGVKAENINPALVEKYKLEAGVKGIIVTEVKPDSSAAETGLQEGDVIQAVNRQEIKSVEDARKLVKGKDQSIFLKVKRKGDTILLVVKD